MLASYLIYNMLLIGSTFFVSLSERANTRRWSNTFLVVAFFIVWVPAAIRYNIGSDYWSYREIYNSILAGSFTNNIEFGFVIIIKGAQWLGFSFQEFIALTSFLTYAIVFLSYNRKGAAMMHFMYMSVFYLVSLNLIRTALVLSLSVYACCLLIDKKSILKCVLIVFIGTLIHKSAILVIPPLLLWYVFNRQKIILPYVGIFFLISCIIIFLFFNQKFFEFVFDNPITELLGYSSYLSSKYYSRPVEFGSGLGFLLKMLPLFVPFLFIRRFSGTVLGNFVLAITFIALISLMGMTTIGIFSRIQRFYIYVYLFIGLYLCVVERFYERKVLLLGILLWGLIYFQGEIYFHKSNKCVGSRTTPYVTIFDKYNDKSLSGITESECDM